jgi:hypothetical protein
MGIGVVFQPPQKRRRKVGERETAPRAYEHLMERLYAAVRAGRIEEEVTGKITFDHAP